MTSDKTQAVSACFALALLALAAIATPGSADAAIQAGAGVGCTETSAQAEASGDVRASASARMRGSTTYYYGQGGASMGYSRAYAEGDGGSDAWAHGEDSDGNSVSVSCGADGYSTGGGTGGGSGGGGSGGDEDSCNGNAVGDYCIKKPHKPSPNPGILEYLGVELHTLMSQHYEPFTFDGTLQGLTLADGSYVVAAYDESSGLGIVAEGGTFVIGSAADFAPMPGSVAAQTFPVTLRYAVSETAGGVSIHGALGHS